MLFGLPLWQRDDFSPHTRFAIVAESGRVMVHGGNKSRVDPYTIAIDPKTGETLQTYTEGLDLSVSDEAARADRRAYSNMSKRAGDLQLRLAEGVLVQVIREELVAVDVASGKRLWSRKGESGLGFAHPLIENGTMIICEGGYVRNQCLYPLARQQAGSHSCL